MDQFKNVKLNDRIEFPEKLNMKSFTTKATNAKAKASAVREDKAEKDQLEPAMEAKAGGLSMGREESKDAGLDDEVAPGLERKQSMADNDPGSISMNSGDKKATDNAEAVEDDDEEYEYSLVGVVDHMGSADAGHYLSFINVERDKEFRKKNQEVIGQIDGEEFVSVQQSKATWLEFNDHQIKSFAVSDFEQLCYGGDTNQSAYMLFYEKKIK